jgi:hypothetical protein
MMVIKEECYQLVDVCYQMNVRFSVVHSVIPCLNVVKFIYVCQIAAFCTLLMVLLFVCSPFLFPASAIVPLLLACTPFGSY